MAVPDPGEARGRRGEQCVLPFAKRVVRFVGVRHVRGQAFNHELRQFAKLFRQHYGLVRGDPKSVQARVDFDVDARGRPPAFGSGAQSFTQLQGVNDGSYVVRND